MNQTVKGTFLGRFERAVEAFADNFLAGWELGAALCVYQDGVAVVDVWKGQASCSREWCADTMLPLTSISKCILSCMILLFEKHGELCLEDRIAHYWPEFGGMGKQDIRIADALSHSSGLPAFPYRVQLEEQQDRHRMRAIFERMAPAWPTGRYHGYHAITLGFLLQELLWIVAGRAPDQLLKQIASGTEVGVRFQLTEADLEMVGEIQSPTHGGPSAGRTVPRWLERYSRAIESPTSLFNKATVGSTAMQNHDVNEPRFLLANRPSAYGTARGVAKLLYSLVAGDLSSEKRLTQISRCKQFRRDLVFEVQTAWKHGFLCAGSELWPLAKTGIFGHIAATGGAVFVDLERRLTACYLPNRTKALLEVPDRRLQRIASALGCNQ